MSARFQPGHALSLSLALLTTVGVKTPPFPCPPAHQSEPAPRRVATVRPPRVALAMTRLCSHNATHATPLNRLRTSQRLVHVGRLTTLRGSSRRPSRRPPLCLAAAPTASELPSSFLIPNSSCSAACLLLRRGAGLGIGLCATRPTASGNAAHGLWYTAPGPRARRSTTRRARVSRSQGDPRVGLRQDQLGRVAARPGLLLAPRLHRQELARLAQEPDRHSSPAARRPAAYRTAATSRESLRFWQGTAYSLLLPTRAGDWHKSRPSALLLAPDAQLTEYELPLTRLRLAHTRAGPSALEAAAA